MYLLFCKTSNLSSNSAFSDRRRPTSLSVAESLPTKQDRSKTMKRDYRTRFSQKQNSNKNETITNLKHESDAKRWHSKIRSCRAMLAKSINSKTKNRLEIQCYSLPGKGQYKIKQNGRHQRVKTKQRSYISLSENRKRILRLIIQRPKTSEKKNTNSKRNSFKSIKHPNKFEFSLSCNMCKQKSTSLRAWRCKEGNIIHDTVRCKKADCFFFFLDLRGRREFIMLLSKNTSWTIMT